MTRLAFALLLALTLPAAAEDHVGDVNDMIAFALPDPAMTPGAIDATVTLDQIGNGTISKMLMKWRINAKGMTAQEALGL